MEIKGDDDMKKRILILTILLVILMSLPAFASSNKEEVRLLVNGKNIRVPEDYYGKPYINEDGRTMITLRMASFFSRESEIGWDDSTKIATVRKKYKIKIDDNVVKTVDGEIVAVMDTVAVIKDSKVYVPLKFLTDVLGYNVEYIAPSKDTGNRHLVNVKMHDVEYVPSTDNH